MEFIDEPYDFPIFLINGRFPKSFGRVCCICESSETYIYKGRPIWARYKDENGNITDEWTCHKCHRKKKGYKNNKNKICRICGSNKTRIKSNGDPIWVKNKDIKGKLTDEHLCYKCYYLAEKRCYVCGKKNYINREYINRQWSGRFICNNCRKLSNQD